MMNSYIGYIGLTFLRCVSLNVPSKRLHMKMQSYTGCICSISLHCMFSDVSSNGSHEKIHIHTEYIFLTFQNLWTSSQLLLLGIPRCWYITFTTMYLHVSLLILVLNWKRIKMIYRIRRQKIESEIHRYVKHVNKLSLYLVDGQVFGSRGPTHSKIATIPIDLSNIPTEDWLRLRS